MNKDVLNQYYLNTMELNKAHTNLRIINLSVIFFNVKNNVLNITLCNGSELIGKEILNLIVRI